MLKLHRVGELALLIESGDAIEPGRVAALLQAWGHPAVVAVTAAAQSVLVQFDETAEVLPSEEAIVAAVLAASPGDSPPGPAALAPRRHSIPARYEGADLSEIARQTRLFKNEVIAIHSSTIYRVAFLGFQPGFAYLQGLDPRLALPRRDSPRERVPAGSVAIAGTWSGIYPSATPGGWQLLGQTTVQLFDAYRAEPCLLRAGDEVEFLPC